jgi:ubiquinone/menaquinone biosynthesis C-methylase UbiE|tara:strand:+ start:2085 stop:2780 length:696 start_codon:yes stop_codon:yes gene_type:complete
MLDKDQIKNFWEAQSQKKNVSHESISNLEEDPGLVKLKIDAEVSKVIPLIKKNLTSDNTLLDLGGGSGQWAIRFAQLLKNCTLVEFSEGMLSLAKKAAALEGNNNIEFVHCPAQDFTSEKKFDFIWISGLLIYLNDDDVNKLLQNCYEMLQPEGSLILRDGTGLGSAYQIQNQYSQILKQNYSAFYRTSDDYINLFLQNKFKLISDEDMFEAGSPLNKWEQTRLRLYQFNI